MSVNVVNDAAAPAASKALVLSGGGALGGYEAGVIAGLRKAGRTFDVVCGTSIGAINAAFVAQGAFDELDTLWHTIGAVGVIELIAQVQALEALLHDVEGVAGIGKPILPERIADFAHAFRDYEGIGPFKVLIGLLGALNPAPIASLLTGKLDLAAVTSTLIVSATNLTRGTSDAFYVFRGANAGAQAHFERNHPQNAYPFDPATFVDTVRASTSIPGAFPPVTIPIGNPAQSCGYVDGGVANNTPIGLAIDAGATDVTIVFLEPPDAPAATQAITNLGEIGLACFSVMQQKILDSDLKTAMRVNDSAQSGAKPRRRIPLWTIRPKTPLGVSVLQFDNQPGIDAIYQQGLADAANPVLVSGG